MKAIPRNENAYKSRPALRLIGTKELPREDWLTVRKQGIGNVMTTDLAFELEGAHRHKLLAAQQLIVLGELLVERVLNTQPFTTQTPQP